MSEDGFFSRWARRKVQVQRGLATAETAPPAEAPAQVPAGAAAGAAALAPQAAAAPAVAVHPAAEAAPAPPPPTLDEARALTPEADFSRFVKPDVSPEVKNTALKRLFADPHFNVMDGLDTYIDDYGRPDPLPASMLRQMVQARALGLFRDEQAAEPAIAEGAPRAPVTAEGAPRAPVTDSPEATPAETPRDEDPDLRLQPHDAAGHARAGAGAGEDPGRQR